MEPSLRVDRQSGAGRVAVESTDPAVPPALIALDRERHFCLEPEPLVQTSGQSSEELGLGDVPDWVGTRVRPNPNVEANDRADSRELSDAHVRDEAALDAHHLRRGPTDSGADEPKRQASSDARIPELVSDLEQVVIDEA